MASIRRASLILFSFFILCTITAQFSLAAHSLTIVEGRPNTTEKLKRGLTTFMNHLNPAPYFVPPQQAISNSKTAPATGLQAEPATIINDGPSADVLIKGPNRLVQARPLGGPLRWGRR